jgi:hypothetical protein
MTNTFLTPRMDPAMFPLTRTVFSLAVLFAASSTVPAAEPSEPARTVSTGAGSAFVATSKVVRASYDRGLDDTRAHVDLYCHDRKTVRCQFRCFEIPAGAQKMTLKEAIKFGGFEAWTAQGTLEKTGDLNVRGIHGEEYLVKGLNRESKVRVFIAHGRAYILSVMLFPDRKPDDVERDVRSFFESFQIAER